MFSHKHQKASTDGAQAQQQQQQQPFAPQPGYNDATPTNITVQIPAHQQMAQGGQPHIQQQPQPGMGVDGGFAPAGQTVRSNDGQLHQFGAPGAGAVPQFQQPQSGMGAGDGFAPAGQTFHTDNRQGHQFGAPGTGSAPHFQQPAGMGMGTSSLAGGQQRDSNDFAHAGKQHQHTAAGMHPATDIHSEAGNVAGQTGELHRGTGAERSLHNPMNIQQTPEGGIAVDGRSGLPLGHATASDKLVGKLEQSVGKMVGDRKMQNDGELRATGGKAAVAGQARAPVQ